MFQTLRFLIGKWVHTLLMGAMAFLVPVFLFTVLCLEIFLAETLKQKAAEYGVSLPRQGGIHER